MQLAIGISLSDLLIMFLCYFGLIQYFEKDIFQIALGFGGSAIMVIYGIYMFNKKTASKPIQKEINLKINWTGVFRPASSDWAKSFGIIKAAKAWPEFIALSTAL